MKRTLLLLGVLHAGAAFAGDVIASRAELESYLAAHTSSPLDALSPGARERFLVSLTFGRAGIDGLDASDLMDELDDAQIHAVLALFGPRALDVAPPSHAADTRGVEKRVREPGAIGALERRYNFYYAATRAIDREATDLQQAAMLGALFDAQLATAFEKAALRKADDHELRLLRAAARRVALATGLPAPIDAFRAVFAERVRRGLVSGDDANTLRNLHLVRHRVANARGVARTYPLAQLAPLPAFVDSPGAAAPSVWRFSADGRTLTRATLDLAPLQILVTVDSAPSRELATAVSADPVLAPLFERRASWLTRAPGVEDIEAVRDWNRGFPRAQAVMVYDRSEWPVIPDWRPARIHIVRGGATIETFDGWDGSSASRDALNQLLRRHGFLPGRE